MKIKPTVSVDVWQKRIAAARRRRQKYEDLWAAYARFHTNAYLAVRDVNDDKLVNLPNGDQVKVGALHRNIEQTMGLLEVPEIGVRVIANDYTRELGQEDTHREQVVEQGLLNSLHNSGLVKQTEEADPIKRDAIIIGHGINFTEWRVMEEEVEGEPVYLARETNNGLAELVLDETTGEPMMEFETTKEVIWEGCADRQVSPLNFLFSATAKSIRQSPWHGKEEIIALEELKRNERYQVPRDIKPTSFRVRDIYGDTQDEVLIEDESVMTITIYDKFNRELITFIETARPDDNSLFEAKRKVSNKNREKTLVPIEVVKYPVRFSHPDDSPFVDLVLIPANDHPFGISQLEHVRNQAVEMDKLRTRAANLTRQLKMIVLYQKGKIDQDQLRQAINSSDTEPVGVDFQDGDDWKNLFQQINLSGIPKEIYQQIAAAANDINETSGIPGEPLAGADTATESDNQMSIAGARTNRKRRLYLKFLSDIASRHRDFLKEFAPAGQSIAITTMDGRALTLEYGRQAFDGKLDIEVLPGGGAMNISPVKQKMMVETVNLFKGQFGPQFDLILLRQVLTMTDARDINALMNAARLNFGIPPATGQAAPTAALPNLNEGTSNGQVIRSAINAMNEGSLI
jgi:hypothetical protein